MTTLEMDAIAAEVLRRIALRTSDRRVLLLLGSASESQELRTYLRGLEQENCVFTQLLQGDEAVCGCLETVHQVISLGAEAALPLFSELVERQNLVVVSGLTLAQLSNIRDLRIGSGAEDLICEALRQGKRVRAFSDALAVSLAHRGFAARIKLLRTELEDYGMEFDTRSDGLKAPCQLRKPVISKQDLREIEGGAVIVGRDTVFTTTARQLLEEKNIEIIRR